MTQGFFYTDPLAAAWQAKHFGMQFGIKHNRAIHWNCIGRSGEAFEPLRTASDILDPISDHSILYVHPDSLHLLKPQDDDIVLMDDGEGANSVEFWREGMNKGRLISVIQRDCIAFHWPQTEEA